MKTIPRNRNGTRAGSVMVLQPCSAFKSFPFRKLNFPGSSLNMALASQPGGAVTMTAAKINNKRLSVNELNE
jgi:hypothetical protein